MPRRVLFRRDRQQTMHAKLRSSVKMPKAKPRLPMLPASNVHCTVNTANVHTDGRNTQWETKQKMQHGLEGDRQWTSKCKTTTGIRYERAPNSPRLHRRSQLTYGVLPSQQTTAQRTGAQSTPVENHAQTGTNKKNKETKRKKNDSLISGT